MIQPHHFAVQLRQDARANMRNHALRPESSRGRVRERAGPCYLSQDEVDALLAGITKLSAPYSHVVATWIRPAKDTDVDGQPIVMKSGLHRTFFEDPTATLARAGAWRLQSQHSIEKWGAGLGVAVPTSPVGGGYWLTIHSLIVQKDSYKQ